ncbi:sterol O-acyltransferase 2 [Spathaspora passalidarum NRRL Y-27907]|uniref:O-acyltransferase n=1 Tax=Spathaspora passalidarum (strain NRRL Y-27907 / 11-Y1) TaxID=619300 RepID=G3AKP0_SPAPN|nr:sterol O-acyltransferase 2 [Spathaspora passalidarum NRRL Y-27907]EGW32944.1 sterol O-acyltransferase 2 [Spathaspora passalidarum NRRL Y-27907]
MLRSSTLNELNRISKKGSHRKLLALNNDYTSSSGEEDNVVTPPADDDTSPVIEVVDKVEVVDQVEMPDPDSAVELRYRRQSVTLPSVIDYVTKAEKPHKYVSKFSDFTFKSTSTTIFDADYFTSGEFFGFYVLFWLGTFFFMFNNIVHTYLEDNSSILEWPVVKVLRKDLIKVGLTDLAMYLSTYFAFWVQYACRHYGLSWRRFGWFIQGVYDGVFIFFWLYVASESVMGFPWVAREFLVLHSLVFVMKMHSYGFYNGYLWSIYKEGKFSENYLQRLEAEKVKLPDGYKHEDTVKLLKESQAFCKYELIYQSHATTADKDEKLDPAMLDNSISDLQKQGLVTFPHNITLRDFFRYSMYPTVIYTLDFPTTPRIRWSYVGAKVCAIFGIIFLMVYVAHVGMYPLVLKAKAAKTLPTSERIPQFFSILFDMILPFLMLYLFTFYLIWDSILNAIAELSRYGDREFYGPWWNCSDWGEFARLWNIPVHKFLLRHVYHSSISTFRVNKHAASFFTFFLSSLVHELVMYVIFGNLRGYLLFFQMSQIPMQIIAQMNFFKNKRILGNVFCWIGFIAGPSIICTLYLVF